MAEWKKRDYCNKENDKALTDCPVAAPAVSSICVKQIAEVTDPGTMTTLMNPPPVGTGPAPPFANAPCVTKQGPCQKDVADQFMMGIITEFQEAIKTLGKDSAAVGKAMGEGGAAMGKGGGQMGAAAAFLEMPERSTILLDIGSELQLKMMGDPGAALEQFAKADVDARHAQMEWGNALVDKADFQVATAEQSTDKCAQAAALINRGKAKEGKRVVWEGNVGGWNGMLDNYCGFDLLVSMLHSNFFFLTLLGFFGFLLFCFFVGWHSAIPSRTRYGSSEKQYGIGGRSSRCLCKRCAVGRRSSI